MEYKQEIIELNNKLRLLSIKLQNKNHGLTAIKNQYIYAKFNDKPIDELVRIISKLINEIKTISNEQAKLNSQIKLIRNQAERENSAIVKTVIKKLGVVPDIHNVDISIRYILNTYHPHWNPRKPCISKLIKLEPEEIIDMAAFLRNIIADTKHPKYNFDLLLLVYYNLHAISLMIMNDYLFYQLLVSIFIVHK